MKLLTLVLLSFSSSFHFVGENTTEVQEASWGKFVLIADDTYNYTHGDTIVLSDDAPIVDGFLMGGDYHAIKVSDGKHLMK